MMINKSMLILSVLLFACSQNKTHKLLIMQQISLTDHYKLFWFNDANSVSLQKTSYFQIAQDVSEICPQKANAYCRAAIQISRVTNDTIFILAAKELIQVRDSRYVLKTIDYSPDLYDLTKRPNDSTIILVDNSCDSVE